MGTTDTPTRTQMQQAKTANATVQPTPSADIPSSGTTNINPKTNAQRASVLLTKCGHVKFSVSPTSASLLCMQSFELQLSSNGELIIDGGTNISLMGRQFHIIASTGRLVDMEGFANGLTKSNVEIKSGVATCTTATGERFLLGIHEAPHLPHNRQSLLSTSQS